MPKIERNAACPCGSGKKYKRCCLEKDQQVEHAAFAERAAKLAAFEAKSKVKRERFRADVLANGVKSEEFRKWEKLEIDYNNVIDLIAAGSIDQAERVAADLLLRFPDLPEGHQCLGMVEEARGNHSQAAHHYRQALDIVRAHPDDFDPEFEVTLQTLIARPDPSIKT